MIDFIGIGAQKSGTSWAYACLYEHPEICAPIKEIHFFSRPRFEKGKEWYESHFTKCDGKKKGEFSTSYLYSVDAPARIYAHYPEVKLIAILRNPITRAYSQYGNAIKAGEVPESMTFEEYQKKEPSVIEQGFYAKQLSEYRKYFKEEQMLVLIYEDIDRDPKKFMEHIYTFLGVDPTFVPTMLHTPINVSRVPKRIYIDRAMHHVAEFLRKVGFDRLVWVIRKFGLPDMVRSVNTKKKETRAPSYDKAALQAIFLPDAKAVSEFTKRDMAIEWGLE